MARYVDGFVVPVPKNPPGGPPDGPPAEHFHPTPDLCSRIPAPYPYREIGPAAKRQRQTASSGTKEEVR